MLIKKLQNILFLSVMCFLGIAIPIQEYYNWIDSAILLYSGIIISGILILIYWIYWFRISEERSPIFVINGLLVFAIVLTVSFQLVLRIVFLRDTILHEDILKSDWWAYRIAPEFFIFLCLLIWIISRMYGKLPIVKEDADTCIQGVMDENKLNVLSIDDDPKITETLKMQLISLKKYNVFTANTIEEGLKCFRERRYFLVFLDLRFFNEFEESRNLAKIMREEDKYVWISVLTGYAYNALNQELLEYIDDIVIKPLLFNDLKAYLLLWNLRYKRRIYYMKDIDRKFDCYGEKIRDMHFILSQKKNNKSSDPC